MQYYAVLPLRVGLANLSTLILYTSFRHLNLFNLIILLMHYTLVLA